MRLRNFFRSADPFKPGIYKHQVEFSDGGIRRIHLRVENDLNAILWLNGNESFYLNESAALFSWILINQYNDEEAKRIIKMHFHNESAFSDFLKFKPLMQNVFDGVSDSADLCESGIDLITPFSKIPDAPYRMDIALTYNCNNHCSHCYNEQGRGKSKLSLEQWKHVIDCLDEIAIPHIVFTGGEPTLVPFLHELIAYSDKKGIVSGLNTNGRLLRNQELTGKLADSSLDHVQITLESIDPEIHDDMVGVTGAWAETVAGIKMAVKYNIHINTNTTLLSHNSSEESIEKLSDFLADLGVKTFGLNALIYSGKGREVQNGISSKQLPKLLKAAKTAAERNDQRLLWYTPTLYCEFDPVKADVGFKSCSAAKYSMCIEPDGNVLPCQSWYEPVGNILQDSWKSIWNHPLCVRLRNKEYMPEKCRSCGSYDICTCGCPLEAEKNASLVKFVYDIPDCF